MMRPEDLREFATQWRNLAAAAQEAARFMRTTNITGCVVFHGDAAALHAASCAEQLEERAHELETTRDPQ